MNVLFNTLRSQRVAQRELTSVKLQSPMRWVLEYDIQRRLPRRSIPYRPLARPSINATTFNERRFVSINARWPCCAAVVQARGIKIRQTHRSARCMCVSATSATPSLPHISERPTAWQSSRQVANTPASNLISHCYLRSKASCLIVMATFTC
ncbi:hypothetical protein BC629DRAFT_1084413 [Irpex lacteus]|nr:hypothetical protein BC629DRAFT_1084413 [Irpex lacteus]